MSTVEDRLDDIEVRLLSPMVTYKENATEDAPALAAALRAVVREHRPMPPLSNPDPTPNCWTCDEPSPCDTIRAIAAAMDVAP